MKYQIYEPKNIGKGNTSNFTIDNLQLIEDNGKQTGGLESIREGENITIDNTDPLNPIVSSIGGGTSGDYIPLTGTEEGKPITGPIELTGSNMFLATQGTNPLEISEQPSGTNGSGILVNPTYTGAVASYIDDTEHVSGVIALAAYGKLAVMSVSTQDLTDPEASAKQMSLVIDPEYDQLKVIDEIFEQGLVGDDYYGENYDENTYIQKLYADIQHSYSTEETLTGGTWIDGKPIYRKVLTGLGNTGDGYTQVDINGGTAQICKFDGYYSYAAINPAIPFNTPISALIGFTNKFTLSPRQTTIMDGIELVIFKETEFTDFNYGYTLIVEYTKTTD